MLAVITGNPAGGSAGSYRMTRDTCGCTDIDECTTTDPSMTHNCDANADCSNNAGSFQCTCQADFTGNGQICSPTDVCASGNHSCDVQATCSMTATGHTCTCNSGFTAGANGVCVDDDECSLGSDNCSPNARCVNQSGGFACICNTGFTGDGVSCDDEDECKLNTDDCDTNASCTNTIGSFTCKCNNGFTGSGKGTNTCSNINECEAGTDDCDDNATCTDNIGSYTCACNAQDGFSGDGFNCAVDVCNLCDPLATCSSDKKTCNCPATHEGSGLDCNGNAKITQKAAIPLNNIPQMSNGVVTDAYWNEIAGMGQGTNVVLEDSMLTASGMINAINFLSNAGVGVYATINAKESFQSFAYHILA